jgi:hypothetical protein
VVAPAGGAPPTELAAGSAGQQRHVTPVAPMPPGAGSVPPYAGGPPVTGPPPWSGPGASSWSPPPAPAGRGRRRTWLLAALALVVALVVGLVVWSPWSGPDLVSRDLVVVPYAADVPDDWETFTVTGDLAYAVLGTRDWTQFAVDDGQAVADAETALTDDPESLVHLYVDMSDNVYTSDAQGLAEQIAGLAEGSRIVAQGTLQVDEREAFAAGGVAPLGDGQLRLYAVTLQDEPRLMLLFICPEPLYEEWRPVFDRIVDSVHFTG